jgi:hypothetical protein
MMRRQHTTPSHEVRARAVLARPLLRTSNDWFFKLWNWRNDLLHLADITSNSTISMAITKVVISENVSCNGWLWK